MGSKGRMPLNMRRPLPGPGMFHPDPYGPGIRPAIGALPHDLMPPLEIIEQKLAAQHMEMQTLATENQRLAATHSALRHELAAAQHELQRLQTHMSTGKFEHEQKMMAMFDKFGKMEADLRATEPLKVELQQAHAEAQSLVAARQELISKVQDLTQDLQKNHGDAQQIPSLISELDALRQEYQHCRATYDYERKLRIDHYESLQVMEKNYVSMLGEVEKLQRELVNAAHADKTGGPYGSNVGYKESDPSGQHSAGQNAYDDGYRAPQIDLQNTAFIVQVGQGARIQLANAIIEAGNTGATIQFSSIDFPKVAARAAAIPEHDVDSERFGRRPHSSRTFIRRVHRSAQRPISEVAACQTHLSVLRATDVAKNPRKRISVFERLSQPGAPATTRTVTGGKISVVTANTTTLSTRLPISGKNDADVSSYGGRLTRRQRRRKNAELRAQQQLLIHPSNLPAP